MVPVSDPFRLRLTSQAGITQEHVEAAARLQSLGLPSIVQARATLEEDHEPAPALFVIRRGWAFASKLLPNGARQVLEFYMAGDVVGCGSVFLPTAQQMCETVTETVLTEIPLDPARRLARQSPAVMEILLSLIAQDRAALAERLVDLGRRESVARVGHLLLQLWRRLLAVGIATPSGYPCPLSQYLIADATGLTAIHVNRVLRELREDGIVTFRHGCVKFHDFSRLVQLTGFDHGSTRSRSYRRSGEEKGVA